MWLKECQGINWDNNKSLLQQARINQPEWADRQYFDRK
jgi:hypothetical protein